MKVNMNVLSAIKLLNLNKAVEETFTQGGCYQFARALKLLMGKGEVVYSSSLGHAYYRLDRILYDIKGYHFVSPKVELLEESELFMGNHWPHRWPKNSVNGLMRFRLRFFEEHQNIVYGFVYFSSEKDLTKFLESSELKNPNQVLIEDRKNQKYCILEKNFKSFETLDWKENNDT